MIRFTVFPYFRAEFKIDVVPRTAGVISSKYIVFVKRASFQRKNERTIGFGSLEMKRRGGVDYDINTFYCLIERPALGDILNNDQLKSISVLGKFFFQEGAFSE